MKERLQEVFDGLQERMKSPFFVTFIIVWSLHHWKLLFILMSFDEDLNQGYKKSIVETYIFNHHGWFGMLIYPLLWSFCSVMGYYIISLIYEAINLIYSKYGRPLVNMLDKNKLALKEEVDREKKKISGLRSDIKILLQKESDLNDDIKILKSQFSILTNDYKAASEIQSELRSKLDEKADYDNVVKDLQEANGEVVKLTSTISRLQKLASERSANHENEKLIESFIQRHLTDFNEFKLNFKPNKNLFSELAELLPGTWQITYSKDGQQTSKNNFSLKINHSISEGDKIYKIESIQFGQNGVIILDRRLFEDRSGKTQTLIMTKVKDDNYNIVFSDNSTSATLQRLVD